MALTPADNWAYSKQIDITDANSVSADYQMKLTIHKGDGADVPGTGTIYCDNHCLDFHDDIRFGTTDDPATATQLDQWVESSDANTIILWVKCPTDGSNTFYMFIGRATTGEFSDGAATFVVFDDFEDYDIDEAPKAARGWTTTAPNGANWWKAKANPYGSGKVMQGHSDSGDQNGDNIIQDTFATAGGYAIYYKVYKTSFSSPYTLYGSMQEGVTTMISLHYTAGIIRWHDGGAYVEFNPELDPKPGVWSEEEHKITSTSYVLNQDGTDATGGFRDTPTAGIDTWQIQLFRKNTHDLFLDDFRIRKYASPEPSWDTFGAWNNLLVIEHTPSDTISISDSVTFKHGLNLSDTLTIDESILLKHFVTLADSINISDSMESFFKIMEALSDSVNIDDTLAFKHTLNLTDTINISDIIAFKHLIALADNIGISDVAVLTYIVNLSDSVNISDITVFKHVVALLDSLSTSDIIAFKHLLNLSDDVNISDAIIYKHLVALADSLGINDSPVFKHLLALIDAINIDDSITFKHIVHLFDNILISDATVISAVLADTLSIDDSIMLAIKRIVGIHYITLQNDNGTCTIIAPEQVSTDHAQNIKEMNMWNGERIVFGESRSKWSLLLKGQDWENDACNRILCLKQQGLDGIPIAISGLGNPNWDTEWMIKSIGWKLVFEKPLHYEWIILLEKT